MRRLRPWRPPPPHPCATDTERFLYRRWAEDHREWLVAYHREFDDAGAWQNISTVLGIIAVTLAVALVLT